MQLSRSKAVWILVVVVVAVGAIALGFRFAGSYFLNKGISNMKNGDYASAKSDLMHASQVSLNDPLVYAYLGVAALGKPDIAGGNYSYPQADFNTAVGYFEKAISFGIEKVDEKGYLNSLYGLGFSYRALGKYDVADTYFLKYIEKKPNESFAARYLLAVDYFVRFNKPKEARDLLIQALAGKKSQTESFKIYAAEILLARIYNFFGDYDSSLKIALLGIKDAGPLSSANAALVRTAHSTAGKDYAAKGDLSSAEAEMKIANNLPPQNVHQCALAEIYFNYRRYDEAIALAKKYANPKYPISYSICLNTLGKSYLAKGNKAAAKDSFQKYIDFVSTLPAQSIFVIRDKASVQAALAGL